MYKVLDHTGRCIFLGGSLESAFNFIRENDWWNRQIHGLDAELDEYEIIKVLA